MQPSQNPYQQNPYESPQAVQPSMMPVAGWAPGTIDQRMAYPENTIVELRRWKQGFNSLKFFIAAQVITVLGCLLGLAILLNIKARQDNTLYLFGTILLLTLALASLIGVWQRAAWAVPLSWLCIGFWLLLSLVGCVASLLSNHPEVISIVIQMLAYAVILIIFVGKALREGERYFGPNLLDEHQLKQELAYREMNSIP